MWYQTRVVDVEMPKKPTTPTQKSRIEKRLTSLRLVISTYSCYTKVGDRDHEEKMGYFREFEELSEELKSIGEEIK